MHEPSLAHSVAVALIEIAKSNNFSKVKEVEISVSEGNMIDEDIFMFWLKEMLKGTIFENANIRLVKNELRFKCNSCGNVWSLSEVKESLIRELCGDVVDCDTPIHYLPDIIQAYMKCPVCKSNDIEVLQSSGIMINRVIGE